MKKIFLGALSGIATSFSAIAVVACNDKGVKKPEVQETPADVDNELAKFTDKKVDLTAKVAADNLKISQLGIIKTQGFTYAITHDAINKNGNVQVMVKITKDDVQVQKNITVTVAQLNVSLATLKEVKSELAKFTDKTVNLTAVVASDKLTNTHLGINEASGFTYAYTHAAINVDGSYKVKVTIIKGGQLAEKIITITVAKLNVSLFYLSQVKSELARFNNKSIDLTAVVASNELTNTQLKIVKTLGFTYAYIHDAINKNGNVQVTVKIAKDGQEAEKIITIAVAKLTEIFDLKAAKEKLPQISDTKSIDLTAKVTANSLTSTQLKIVQTSGFTYTYIHEAINKNGDLQVIVKITKGGQTAKKTITVTVANLNESIKDLKAVESEINTIKDNKILALSSDIGVNSINASQVGIVKKEWFTYDITHDAINKNGDAKVTVKITKGGQEAEKIITITIKNLTEALNLKAVQTELDRVPDTKSIELTTKVAANGLTKAQVGIVAQTEFASEITHDEIVKNGEVAVKVKITKGSQAKEKDIKIIVNNLDEALATKALETQLGKVPNTKAITISSNVAADGLTSDQLGIVKEVGYTYTFTHAAITGNVSAKVTVKIEKSSKSLEKVITINVTKTTT